MPSNLVQINNSYNYVWEVPDSAIQCVIDSLDNLGERVPENVRLPEKRLWSETEVLQERIKQLEDLLSSKIDDAWNALEFLSMLPLHLPEKHDPHIDHYLAQADAYLQRIKGDGLGRAPNNLGQVFQKTNDPTIPEIDTGGCEAGKRELTELWQAVLQLRIDLTELDNFVRR